MRGHESRPVEDPDLGGAERDLDALLHEPVRNAVADGVDIDESVVGHPTAEASLGAHQN